MKDNIRFGEKETRIEVDLNFQGSCYTIKRGNSLVELWKDGQQMELGNKTQTKEGILRELPFIEAMDLLYYNEGNQRILGNSSSSDTVDEVIYKGALMKSENTTLQVSGLSTADTSKYFLRIASMYRPSNTGILGGA